MREASDPCSLNERPDTATLSNAIRTLSLYARLVRRGQVAIFKGETSDEDGVKFF